jgi:hypothetical protein
MRINCADVAEICSDLSFNNLIGTLPPMLNPNMHTLYAS